MKLRFKTAFFLFLLPAIVMANNDRTKPQEKSKTINKTFTVNSNATVSVDNKYGNIDITTWNKNTVEISVKITVKGDDLDDVEDKLNNIQVNFENSDSLVKAKTTFGSQKNSWSFWGKKRNLSYKVNYTIKMPISNQVDLNNDYGNIALDKLNGNANINCDYGKITIGDLMGKSNNINLDYCSTSTISSMNDANINIDYSKLNIGSSKEVRLNADYSTVKFNKVDQLTFNTDYGSIRADWAAVIKGNGDYTSLRFGTLTKSLKVNSDYGAISINNLAKGFDFIDIESEYAGVKIGVEPNTSFSFLINLQYAGLRKDDNLEILKKNEKGNKKYYQGYYGSQNSKASININSQYGSVSIKEN